jgi:hypothetical protein
VSTSAIVVTARRPRFLAGTPPTVSVDGGGPRPLVWGRAVRLEVPPGEHEVMVVDLPTESPVGTVLWLDPDEDTRLEYRRRFAWYLPSRIVYR